MQTKKQSIIADASSVFSRNTFALVIALVTSILLARYLGPEGRGLYAVVLVYPSLLVGLAELGIRSTTVYLIGNKEHSEKEIIGVLLWCLVASSIISSVIVGGIFLYLNDPDISILMILLALFYIPLKLTISYSQGVFLGKEEIRRFNQLTWIPPVIVLIGVVLLVVIANLDVIGAMIATLAGNACIAY